MQYRSLGQSGLQASAVAFGAWAIGGWFWGGSDEQDSIAALQAGLDAGMNFIDTAPAYGLGLSEEIVGKALVSRREQAVLATKCGLVWDTDRGVAHFEQNGKQIRKYLGAESLRRELEASLRRLGTDYVDLYQTHWQDPTTPIAETMEALLQLKAEGKLRAIGVSNATVAQLEAYRRVGPVDSDQERYSLLDRRLEAELLPYCREHGVAVLAYSPLEQGLLTGKMDSEREFPAGDLRATRPQFGAENRRRVNAMLQQDFAPVAQKRGITLAQLVIAWTIGQPGVTHALVGARHPRQALENAAAAEVAISESELAVLQAAVEAHGLSGLPYRG